MKRTATRPPAAVRADFLCVNCGKGFANEEERLAAMREMIAIVDRHIARMNIVKEMARARPRREG